MPPWQKFKSDMETLQNINALASQNRISEALAELDKLPDGGAGNAEALFMRGKLLWRLGRRHDAMNAYVAAQELDPAGPAAMALEQARQIDAFYNRDLYNP